MLRHMADPDLPYPPPVAPTVQLPAPPAGWRVALIVWGAPATLALLVGLMLLATPWQPRTYPFGETPDVIPGAVVLALANLAAVMGVALSRYRLGLASALVALPWVLSPFAATMAWGWWSAGLAVLGFAVFDGARRHAAWVGSMVVLLALVYCTSGVYWSVPLSGPVDLHSHDPARWFDATRFSYLAAYLGTIVAVVLAANATRHRLTRRAAGLP